MKNLRMKNIIHNFTGFTCVVLLIFSIILTTALPVFSAGGKKQVKRAIMAMAHELTHIWQFENWNEKLIKEKYGASNEIVIYEGMAVWSSIQYAYMIGEIASAKREEIIESLREDEYGV